MAIIEIHYKARCKHCFYLTTQKISKNRRQAYCNLNENFTTLKTEACKNFKL